MIRDTEQLLTFLQQGIDLLPDDELLADVTASNNVHLTKNRSNAYLPITGMMHVGFTTYRKDGACCEYQLCFGPELELMSVTRPLN